MLSGPPPIAVVNIRAMPVKDSSSAMVTLDIQNDGRPDRLIAARAPDAKLTVLKAPASSGLPVPADSKVSLAMEAGHIMLMSVQAALTPGTALPLELEFESAGVLQTKATVSGGMAMDHGRQLGVDAATAPTLDVTVSASENGWSVTLETDRFEFSRDLVDGPHVPGTGHAHLYVSGTKIGRLYSQQGRIEALPSGEHTITVTLNTNDHRAYAVDGVAISAQARINVP